MSKDKHFDEERRFMDLLEFIEKGAVAKTQHASLEVLTKQSQLPKALREVNLDSSANQSIYIIKIYAQGTAGNFSENLKPGLIMQIMPKKEDRTIIHYLTYDEYAKLRSGYVKIK